MHIIVIRQGKSTRLPLGRAAAGPKLFQFLRLNLYLEMIELENKLDLSLGLIPNLAVNAHLLFFVTFSF